MRPRLALLLIPVLLIGLVPGVVAASPADQALGIDGARARHEAIVAFWTPERIRAAVPRDITFDPARGFIPQAPGGVPGKPNPSPDPSPSPSPDPSPSPSPSPSPDPSPSASPSPSGSVTGASWEAGGAILKGTGRVFFVMTPFLYSCSGTVVQDGRAGYSLVLTAGHCVSDKGKFATQWIFIPEYDSNPIEYGDCGNSKYGCWTAQALFVHENFASQKRFNDTAVIHDFAFALMGPGGKSGTASLETTVGSFPIAFSGPTTGTTLSAFGYPASSPYDGLQLTYCRGPIGQDPGTGNATWSMACDMTGGSSGGPWVSGDPLTNAATLRSLNSYGYSGIDNMYGPKFGSRAQAVYDAANGTATSDTRVTGG